MTMPALIGNYRKKELENRFKKTSAIVETALEKTIMEYALYDCAKYPANLKSCSDTIPDSLRVDANSYFAEQFRVVEKPRIVDGAPVDKFSLKLVKIPVFGYNGRNSGYFNGFVGAYDTGYTEMIGYILTDSTFISTIAYQTHGVYDGLKVVFDTNGPFKGPNRYGYDIFIYDSGYWNANDCGGQYDYGCCKYAQADKSPDDSTKKYWENLKI